MEREDLILAELSLRKMLSKGYFDICTIDAILKLGEIPRGGRDYDRLRTLHCIHYAEMSEEVRSLMVNLIGRVLSMPSLDTNSLFKQEAVPATKKNHPPNNHDPLVENGRVISSGIRRLLGM